MSTYRKGDRVGNINVPNLHPDQERADAIAAGLRQLADMVTAHPELAARIGRHVDRITVPAGQDAQAHETIRAYVAAGCEFGATLREEGDGTHSGVRIMFGPVGLYSYASNHWLPDTPDPPNPLIAPTLLSQLVPPRLIHREDDAS